MRPIPFDEFLASQEMRDEAWRRRFAMEEHFGTAKPGRGHLALATLYRAGKVPGVVTQNIDNLHQASGFKADDVGLVTGNRRVNPEARILVVVAEILLNRLLHPEAFDFHNVAAVVMDEFHSFADPERGVVWELSLAMLPPHIRLLLLSATVGNAGEFLAWLERSHGRKLELVESKERRVPLAYHDCAKRSPSPGELRKWVQRFGVEAVLDPQSRAYQRQGLQYLSASEDDWLERMAADPAILRLPLARCGKELAVGEDPDGWHRLAAVAKS